MAAIFCLLRQTSKESAERTVSVRHIHKGSTFAKSTGVLVDPIRFNTTTGRVSAELPQAPELNKIIGKFVTRMERLRHDLEGKGIEPDKSAMAQAWQIDEKIREHLIRSEPRVRHLAGILLDELKEELASLLEQVEAKKQEIRDFELQHGIHDGRLLVNYINK